MFEQGSAMLQFGHAGVSALHNNLLVLPVWLLGTQNYTRMNICKLIEAFHFLNYHDNMPNKHIRPCVEAKGGDALIFFIMTGASRSVGYQHPTQ